MKHHFLQTGILIFLISLGLGMKDSFAQKQDFESDFQPLSYPDEFLPNWFGNEVRSTSSRIFQSTNQGRNGSKALAVQPISTFDGKLWIKLSPSDFENPEVIFYAKTLQNGTGNRPALVFYSWGESLDGEFSEPIQIGNASEFSNENREFRKYSLSLPAEYNTSEEVILSLDIRYGPGVGSAARWIMDDFDFGDIETDEMPPKIVEVKGYDSNVVWVKFSEKVDPVFSILSIAYVLNGASPDNAQLKSDSVVLISFEGDLLTGKTYSLSISQIPDLEGNFLQDTTINFSFFDPTNIPEKGLVINEIMPAPRVDLDLPNVEYIELFHAGEHEFRMEGLKLSNSRSESSLAEYWLSPGEYLILAPENQAHQLIEYGNVLPVKSWPTLLNSGDQVNLRSEIGRTIDRISFTSATWGESEFSSGGYSLEVPNPYFLCENSTFLMASIEPSRGTPGAQNSVFDPSREISLPQLKSAYFRDSLEVTLIFTDPILPKLTKENLVFSPNLNIDSLIYLSAVELRVSFNSPAQANQEYELKLVGLIDCLGNEIPEKVAILILPQIPEKEDLIINELLFDPRTGDPKFIELKNISQKYLNLENLALANLNSADLPEQVRVFGEQGLILAPGSYLAVTTDGGALGLAYPKSASGNFLEISSLPSYPISGGTVVLLSTSGEVFESFNYSDELHHPLLRDTKGVSLERVSEDSPSFVRSNWQSASENEDYATPGRKNSQALEVEFESNIIQIDPEIFDPEGSSGAAFTSIRYQLNGSGWVGTFRIYSSAGQLIQTLAQNQILGAEGLLTWTGTDSTGKLVRAGYYLLLIELYEPGGAVIVAKKAIVVATRL